MIVISGHEASIEEDRPNKPWRPMPSNRVLPGQARLLMFVLYEVASIARLRLGGIRQCGSLMLLGYWYNDRDGCSALREPKSDHCLRLYLFCLMSLEVAFGKELPPRATLVKRFLTIGGVVFTTVQLQDLYEQAGDRGDHACGRSTLQILVGDNKSRWMSALPMCFWCCFCPWF